MCVVGGGPVDECVGWVHVCGCVEGVHMCVGGYGAGGCLYINYTHTVCTSCHSTHLGVLYPSINLLSYQ